MRCELTLPLYLPSINNRREHWAVRAKRAREHRLAMCALPVPDFEPPYTVTIERCGPRKLDDDNLAGACKSVRDGIAARLTIDDGDTRITWLYRQAHGPHGVRVLVTSRSSDGDDCDGARDFPGEDAPCAQCPSYLHCAHGFACPDFAQWADTGSVLSWSERHQRSPDGEPLAATPHVPNRAPSAEIYRQIFDGDDNEIAPARKRRRSETHPAKLGALVKRRRAQHRSRGVRL